MNADAMVVVDELAALIDNASSAAADGDADSLAEALLDAETAIDRLRAVLAKPNR